MINKLNNNQIPEGAINTKRGVLGATPNVKSSVSSQTNTNNGTENIQDASLQISFDSIIEQARHAPIQDESAVVQAKALIESGQLDTPQNIQSAAENMLKYGI